MIQYLSESENFKVYSIYESVYLKNKTRSKKIGGFDENDLLIAHHYGDPSGALILPNEDYVIVAGCGLTIYNIHDKSENHILYESGKTKWTNGLFQDGQDDQNIEVRFVSFNNQNELRVFKINLSNLLISELS